LPYSYLESVISKAEQSKKNKKVNNYSSSKTGTKVESNKKPSQADPKSRFFEGSPDAKEHSDEDVSANEDESDAESEELASTPQNMPKFRPVVKGQEGVDNVYLSLFKAKMAGLDHELVVRMFDPDLEETSRASLFDQLDYKYVLRFGWAIPDERALSIIKAYGPIIEIGAGLGYWGRLLGNRGVDYVGYDVRPSPDGRGWCKINAGTPDVLRKAKTAKRALFLCYPDDYENSAESVAEAALANYTGDTVILAGELFGKR